MRNHQWKKYLFAALSGAILFQAPGCDPALGLITISSMVTAGGVTYLVFRVLD